MDNLVRSKSAGINSAVLRMKIWFQIQ